MANNKNFIAKNGVSTGDGYAMPDVRPSLLLDFANSKTLDPRITFTRGSTATYWDGKTTTKAEENLFTYSQGVATNWTNFSNRFTVTTGITAPDGTSTALQLANSSGSTAYFYQDIGYNLSSGTQYTISFYVKSNTGSSETINIMIPSTGASNIATATTSWTRVSWSPTLTSSNSFGGLFVADGVDISVWGFQLEERSSATAYTATTSSPIVKYQPTLQTAASGEARFDHDPVTGESKGLLIEEARTNEADTGQDFTNASWVKSNLSVTGNVGVAPNGSQVADLAIPSTATASHQMYDSTGFSANQAVTSSVYAKLYGNTVYRPRLNMSDNTTGNAYAIFDLVNETAGSLSSSGSWSNLSAQIENVGNGWYRCSLTATKGAGSVILDGIDFLNTSGDGSFAGDGFSGLLLWGKQLELGSFPTSYIPTSGSTVTRSADAAQITGTDFSSFADKHSMTIFADYDIPYSGGQSRGIFCLGDPTSNYIKNLAVYAFSSFSALRVDNHHNGIADPVFGITTGDPSGQKVAFAISYGSAAAGYSGLLTTSSSSTATLDAAIDRLIIGNVYSTTNPYQTNGYIKKLSYYPKRLSNATLQAMTEE